MQNDKARDIDTMNRFIYGRAAEMADRCNFILEFITTFKKINKSGQSIFEYLMLASLVMLMLFGFSHTPFFVSIKGSFENAFNRAVIKILEVPLYTYTYS